MSEVRIVRERYELIKTLQQGPVGRTYLAEDPKEQKKVVLKEVSLDHLPIEAGRSFKPVELLEREGKVLSHLDHPAIPKFLDAFETDEDGHVSFWLVQEYRAGENLRERVETGWHGTCEDVRHILRSVAEAVKYLHHRVPPLIHRDVKPQNILIDDEQNVSLVDLGAVCTRVIREHAPAGSTIVGTPGFVPLEQFAGRPVRASDVYALGMVGVYLLTHTDPVRLLGEDGRVRFRDEAEVDDQELVEILCRMIEPVATDRMQTMDAVIDALDNGLEQAITKKERQPRTRLLVAVSVMVCLVVVGMSGVFLMSSSPDEPAEQEEEFGIGSLILGLQANDDRGPQGVSNLLGEVPRQQEQVAQPPQPPQPTPVPQCMVRLKKGRVKIGQVEGLEIACESLDSLVPPIIMEPGRIRVVVMPTPALADKAEHLYEDPNPSAEWPPSILVDITADAVKPIALMYCEGAPISAGIGPSGKYHVIFSSKDVDEYGRTKLSHHVFDEKARTFRRLGGPIRMEGYDLQMIEEMGFLPEPDLPLVALPDRGPPLLVYERPSEMSEMMGEPIDNEVAVQPLRSGMSPFTIVPPQHTAAKKPLTLFMQANRIHALYGFLKQEGDELREAYLPVVYSPVGSKPLTSIPLSETPHKTAIPCGTPAVLQDNGALRIRVQNEFGDKVQQIVLPGARPLSGPTVLPEALSVCSNGNEIELGRGTMRYSVQLDKHLDARNPRFTCNGNKCVLAYLTSVDSSYFTSVLLRFEL